MILKFFPLGNIVSLCMKIINSVVVVGLYYGFLITLSTGPSYLPLLRVKVMEEGTKKKVSATTGFIMGQLVMFISIYYAPLHLALSRPHTITVLGLPYLLFPLFLNNHKYFFDYESKSTTIRNLMRNLSIQCVFLDNLIYQIFNFFVLPSSMLARLVNIYMFRCNNKMLFVTSCFVGWLIGHILFIKCLVLVLAWIRWIRKNSFIRSNKYIRSNNYLVSKLRNSMTMICSILFLITRVCCLVRISSILPNKLKVTPKTKTEERVESEEESDVEIEKTSEMKGIKQEQEGSTEEDPSSSPFSEEREDPDKIEETEEIRVNGKEKTKDEFDFNFTETGYNKNKSPVYEDSYLNRNANQENSNKTKLLFPEQSLLSLFDYNRWNRPLRYKTNKKLEKAVRTEMSQYFFETCPSDGKQKIAFTYPPSLSRFGEMLKSWSTLEKTLSNDNEFDNYWIYSNNRKGNKTSKEFRNRIEALDKKSLFLDILETRTRLCNNSNDHSENEYFPKAYDPFLSGPYRLTMTKRISPSKDSKDKGSIENLSETFDINWIYANLFADPDYQEFEGQTDAFDKKPFLIEMENLTGKFDRQLKLTKEKERFFKFLLNAIKTHTNNAEESITESNAKESITESNAKESITESNAEESITEYNAEESITEYNAEESITEYNAEESITESNAEESITESNAKESITESNAEESITDSIISKKVPRWPDKLITELEQQVQEDIENGGVPVEYQIRSRKAKYVKVLIPTEEEEKEIEEKENEEKENEHEQKEHKQHKQKEDKQNGPEQNYYNSNSSDNTDTEDQIKEIILPSYSYQSDFRRGLIKGAMRAQRRKTFIFGLFQAKAHSPLFLDRVKRLPRLPFDISKFFKVFFTNWTDKGIESKIVEYIDVEYIDEEGKKKKNENSLNEEERRMEISEGWDNIICGHIIRGSALITQSILRKYIVLPSLIIAKNIGRILLFQSPEWFEDIQEWEREMHVKCTHNGIQVAETEFPINGWREGIQIKILFPFYLKPWHIRPSDRNLIEEENQKDEFCFLTVWGRETNLPFGSPRIRKGDSFFDPIFKELQPKIEKFKRAYLDFYLYLLGKTKLVLKETKKFIIDIIERLVFITRILKQKVLSKFNLIFRLIKVSDSNEIKNEKDSRSSNQIIHESVSLFQSQNWKNYALIKREDLTGRTRTIKNKIERITKEKKKITPSGVYINPTEKGYNAKRFEWTTNIWQILKRRTVRLISQLDCFIKIFLEKVYIDLFLAIINITRLNIQFLFESIKKMPDKPINETKEERLNRKNKNIINFISINILRNRKNLHSFGDLSYLSQAYVFFKLSQTQVSNKLRSVFQYNGMSFFIKDEIKDSFETQGILDSKLSHKKRPDNKWKNWIRGHYQYNLSRLKRFRRWKKMRNFINLRYRKKKKKTKRDSYEKVQSIKGGNSRNSKVDYLVNQTVNQTDNFQKSSKYDLLSYKYINFNYENKGDSPISKSSSQVQLKKNEDISYKSNTHKENFSDIYIWRSFPIPIKNYENINYRQKDRDRKYLDLNFNFPNPNWDLRQQLIIESYIRMDITSNENTHIDTNNYQYPIFEKIDKKKLVYLKIPQKLQTNLPKPRKGFLDWMGMNEEILKRPISHLGLFSFPEFVLRYSLYKLKPWVIPSKILLLNLNLNENDLSEKKNIEGNQKQKGESVSNKEIKNQNRNQKDQKEKESVESKRDLRSNVQKQGNAESVPSTNHEKDIEDPSPQKMKKRKKSKLEKEIDLLLKRFLVFQINSRSTLAKKIIHNIKIYGFLLGLPNPREITISSIRGGEMSLDLMCMRKDVKLIEWIKSAFFLIEPTRLSVKNDAQFIMYQTLGILLVHKIKHQINQGYRKQPYVDKNGFDLLVPETILSHRRRRELRILISFNSKTWNKNPISSTENNCSQSLDLDKENPLNLNKDKNELINFKFFLWPNYRLEDLACMNRYWFDTNNGSRFSMLRIQMYPRLKSR
uniref:Protein TIC 214 n=1 Tax=Dischidia acutifolia TaxID=2684637 RepID=A0A8F5ZAR4_9GENT|nr:Ycf1 [Dischidia acutifolia]QXO88615.1 Ycf1 [Dischidia acutifolia]